MPGKHHLRGFKIAPKKIGSPLRGSWTMVSIALVDARKTSLTGVQDSNNNKKKKKKKIVVGSNPPPPLGKKLDPPLEDMKNGLMVNDDIKEILTAMRVMVVSIGSRGSHIPAMTPRRLRRGVIAGM